MYKFIYLLLLIYSFRNTPLSSLCGLIFGGGWGGGAHGSQDPTTIRFFIACVAGEIRERAIFGGDIWCRQSFSSRPEEMQKRRSWQ